MGTSRATVVPRAESLHSRIWPPSLAARSRMFLKPCPAPGRSVSKPTPLSVTIRTRRPAWIASSATIREQPECRMLLLMHSLKTRNALRRMSERIANASGCSGADS